jgi:hypothetical protein
MSEYISEILRVTIDKEWPKAVKSVDEKGGSK